MFSGAFILCSFLARVGKKRTKETPFKGKRGLVPKNAGNRIFQPCDILSPLKIPLTCGLRPRRMSQFVRRKKALSHKVFGLIILLRLLVGNGYKNYYQHDSSGTLPQILTISKPETATFPSILIAGFCQAFCRKSLPPEAPRPL